MIWVVASLWVKEDREAEFQAYEAQALAILAEHGGEVVSRFRPDSGPTEVHILKIASESAFQAFRDDPRLRALSDMRLAAIERTEILIGPDSQKP